MIADSQSASQSRNRLIWSKANYGDLSNQISSYNRSEMFKNRTTNENYVLFVNKYKEAIGMHIT